MFSYFNFQFLINVIHLLNRSLIAFKSAIRDSSINVPEPITPEMLIIGYELTSLNLIPDLQPLPEDMDYDPSPDSINQTFQKLSRVRSNLIKIYHDEFTNTLLQQAIDRDHRYSPVKHDIINPGCVVLIKEENTKRSNYPMGIVVDTIKNSLRVSTDRSYESLWIETCILS